MKFAKIADVAPHQGYNWVETIISQTTREMRLDFYCANTIVISMKHKVIKLLFLPTLSINK